MELRVEDAGQLKFHLSIDFNWWQEFICVLRDGAGCCRFELRYVEHGVDGMEVGWQFNLVRLITQLAGDFERAKVFLR